MSRGGMTVIGLVVVVLATLAHGAASFEIAFVPVPESDTPEFEILNPGPVEDFDEVFDSAAPIPEPDTASGFLPYEDDKSMYYGETFFFENMTVTVESARQYNISLLPDSASNDSRGTPRISTLLSGTTLSFGTTADGDVWIANNGSVSVFASTDRFGIFEAVSSVPWPTACPEPFVTQTADDVLIFFNPYESCAPKAGMSISSTDPSVGSRTVAVSSSVQTQANYVYPPREAGAGLASPEDGCSASENPDDIEGTFCIVQ